MLDPMAALSARSLMTESARFMWRTCRLRSRKPRPTGAWSRTPSSKALAARCSARRRAATCAISAKAESVASTVRSSNGHSTTRSRATAVRIVAAARACVSATKPRNLSIVALPSPIWTGAKAALRPSAR